MSTDILYPLPSFDAKAKTTSSRKDVAVESCPQTSWCLFVRHWSRVLCLVHRSGRQNGDEVCPVLGIYKIEIEHIQFCHTRSEITIWLGALSFAFYQFEYKRDCSNNVIRCYQDLSWVDSKRQGEHRFCLRSSFQCSIHCHASAFGPCFWDAVASCGPVFTFPCPSYLLYPFVWYPGPRWKGLSMSFFMMCQDSAHPGCRLSWGGFEHVWRFWRIAQGLHRVCIECSCDSIL